MPRYCDIVMKGGITSGVVYPLVAVRLYELELCQHRRNLGGGDRRRRGRQAHRPAAARTTSASIGACERSAPVKLIRPSLVRRGSELRLVRDACF